MNFAFWSRINLNLVFEQDELEFAFSRFCSRIHDFRKICRFQVACSKSPYLEILRSLGPHFSTDAKRRLLAFHPFDFRLNWTSPARDMTELKYLRKSLDLTEIVPSVRFLFHLDITRSSYGRFEFCTNISQIPTANPQKSYSHWELTNSTNSY